MDISFPELDFLNLESLLPPAEQEELSRIRDFLQSEVRPASIEYWNKEEFPLSLLQKMAEYGLGGLQLNHASRLFKGLVYAEIARADVSLCAVVGIHNELVVGMVEHCGSPEQRRRWLPELTQFRSYGAFALTEPEHGSDIAGGLATTAHFENGQWRINGSKRWIGFGTVADFILVWARDTADQNIKGFLVETSRPGVRTHKIEHKIGLRIMQNADIAFEDVVIPAENLLPGAQHFSDVNGLLKDSRAWVGWQSAGLQMAALDIARGYALERQQFGKPLAQFQLIQQALSEMAGNASVSLALMAQLARLQEQGDLQMAHAAMAKATCTRLARETAARGRSILGGNGILVEKEMAKLFCDAEVLYTYEGTYEINSLVLGRALTGMSAFV